MPMINSHVNYIFNQNEEKEKEREYDTVAGDRKAKKREVRKKHNHASIAAK